MGDFPCLERESLGAKWCLLGGQSPFREVSSCWPTILHHFEPKGGGRAYFSKYFPPGMPGSALATMRVTGIEASGVTVKAKNLLVILFTGKPFQIYQL